MRGRAIAAFMMMVLLSHGWAHAAAGAAPTSELVVVDNTVEFTACEPALSFTLRTEGSFRITTFVDQDGNFAKSILTAAEGRFTETLSANGKSLVSNEPFLIISTPDDSNLVGLVVGFHVPGQGMVMLQVGNFFLGPDKIGFAGQSYGSLEDLCGFFADP